MESRREPRFTLNQPVEVTDLERRIRFEGRLANLSCNGARLLLCFEIRRGALLKIAWEQNMLLGEVVYCRPQGEEFAVGIQIEDVLFDFGALFPSNDCGTIAGPVES